MLTVTDNAAAVIRDITAQDEVPPGAGLRISTDPTAGSLTLSVTPQPEEGDQVVDASGARLFVDAEAAPLLEDKALDADVDSEGGLQFILAELPR